MLPRKEEPAPEYVVALSGGFDSAVAMHWALQRGRTRGLYIQHGHPAEDSELRSLYYLMDKLRKHPNYAGIHWRRVQLGFETGTPWAPYRSTVIAATILNHAVVWGASTVVAGTRNRRGGMFKRVEQMAFEAAYDSDTRRPPASAVPLSGWTKRAVLDYLVQPHVGIDLRKLWNCYRGKANDPCGECTKCQETQSVITDVLSWTPDDF